MGRYLLMSSMTWNTFSLMAVLVVRTFMKSDANLTPRSATSFVTLQ